ncbi:MAG: hypothetical protein K2N43_10335 [Lachnospiraceae bacterium]|nr:hypothetical protein [Lachnospiraceae bacterium]
MKKFLRLLCLAAILCVVYLAVTQPHDGKTPALEDIGAEAEEIAGQVKGMYEEYGSAAVEQADEALGDVVEKADQVIEEAVDNAVEGAKDGFFDSIKESVSGFFDGLFAETD